MVYAAATEHDYNHPHLFASRKGKERREGKGDGMGKVREVGGKEEGRD